MITRENELAHIHSVLVENGYLPVAGTRENPDRWHLYSNYSLDGCQVFMSIFACQNEAACKRAVRSLLRRTGVYSVVVVSPVTHTVVTFYSHGPSLDRDWNYYYCH